MIVYRKSFVNKSFPGSRYRLSIDERVRMKFIRRRRRTRVPYTLGGWKHKSPFGDDKGVPDSMQFRRVSVSVFRVTSCASASQGEAGLYAFRFSFTKAAFEQSCILLLVAVLDKNRCATLLRFLLGLL